MLREKFVITNNNNDDASIVAMSNRIIVSLTDNSGNDTETFIVRAQNMHSCLRMAAKIYLTYNKSGPLLNRSVKFKWDEAWNDVIEGYEKKTNEKSWVAIYNKGKVIYTENEHHIFLDMIEKFQINNKGEYNDTVDIAKKAFLSAGKEIEIDYEAGVAMIIHQTKNSGRCGIILRSALKTTTFNFTAVPNKGINVNTSQCLTVASAYLEAIQLAYKIGVSNEELRRKVISKGSVKFKDAKMANERLEVLNAQIDSFENSFSIKYRPERPQFETMIRDAEESTASIYNI